MTFFFSLLFSSHSSSGFKIKVLFVYASHSIRPSIFSHDSSGTHTCQGGKEAPGDLISAIGYAMARRMINKSVAVMN